MGALSLGMLRMGMPGGLVIKGLLGPLSTKETFGAQSQYSVRERTLRIKYYSKPA